MALEPVVLNGRFVRLEPLALEHAPSLLTAGSQPEIWRYLTVPQPETIEDMEAWIEEALAQQSAGSHLPFATIERGSGAVVGTTRYLDIRVHDRSIEIGWTWLAADAQRTPINTEAKYLMLRHAFEELGFVRVQLKTDAKNAKSRAAIERIGGRFEGILRSYQRYWHGAQRDTAMYAILAEDWPGAKAGLEARMI